MTTPKGLGYLIPMMHSADVHKKVSFIYPWILIFLMWLMASTFSAYFNITSIGTLNETSTSPSSISTFLILSMNSRTFLTQNLKSAA